MKARINYKSKKTIIIIAIAVVLLIAAITGTVAYIKGNNNAAAAMENTEVTEPANNGNDSNNNGGVENPNTPNTDNPEQIPIIDDNQNPTTPAQNGDTTTNPGTTTNQGTTTGTTTGNAGTTVPDTEYTQTTVVENPWKTEDITWMPISLQAKTETTGLNINTPNLEVSKTAYVGNQEISAEPVNTVAQPGQEITYVIRIKNTGNLATSTIRTVDAIPEGTEIVEISEGGVLANGKITWKNIIKAGETVELTFKVKVISETEITLISNTAKVNGEDTPTTETPVVTTAKEAYLVVDGELAEATSAKVGDTLRYIITISNNSEVAGKTIVTDNIPEGTEIVEISEGGKLEGNTITWNNVEVVANGETTVSFDVIINKETAAGEVVKEVTNAAVVGEKETPPVITPVANITGKKEVNTPEAKVGDTLIYTITLTNSGNAAGTVTVTDEIPEGTSLVAGSITGDGVESNGTITWNVVVPANDEVSVSFKVTVDATTSTGEAVKEVTNTAVVDGENTPQVTTLVANITGKKEVNTPEAKVGDTLIYTITLTNSGNAAGTVTVTDEIPAGTRIKDPTIDGYDATTNTMTWSNVTVPANGKAITLTLEVIVEGGVSEITNVAQIDNNEIPDRPETVVKYHYTIEHYIQGLDENFELKDTETSGEVLAGTKTSYTANDYTGFTFDDDKTENKGAKVPTNNNLVIKLYYIRKDYKVIYKYVGDVPTGASELPADASYKYEAEVKVAKDATAPGYTFSGWSKEDFRMPANDVEIEGSFTANTDTEYKVEHYLQNLNDSDYTIDATETKTGTTGEMTKAEAKNYPGFTANEFEQKEIAGDGTTVVRIYYVRATYTYTIHYFYNGIEDEEKQEGPFQAKFGAEINSYRDKSEEGKYTQYDITSSNKTEKAILVIGTGTNFINIYYGTPEVSINKDVSLKAANVGDTLYYTIKVSENRKLVNATNIKVTDNLPSELYVIEDSITLGGKLNDAKTEIEWNIDEIEKGKDVELKFTAIIKPNSIGKTISNTAELGGSASGKSTVETKVAEIQALTHELTPGQTGKDAANIVLVMDLSSSMNEVIKSEFVECTHTRTTKYGREYCPEGCRQDRYSGVWGQWKNTTRLDAAKEAAQKFVNTVYAKKNESDPDSKATITVITFNQENYNWYDSKYVGTRVLTFGSNNEYTTATVSNYNELVTEIGNIDIGTQTSGLGTHIRAALDKAYNTIYGTETEDGIAKTYPNNSNYVIFLGDGDPTTSYNNNNKDSIDTSAQQIKDAGATIYSIGFGEDISDKNSTGYKILESISSEKKVYTANDSVTLTQIFTNLAGGMTEKPSSTEEGKIVVKPEKALYFNTADGKEEYITVKYKGVTLIECKSQEELDSNKYLTYSEGILTFNVNEWNSVEENTKILTGGEDLVLNYYVAR